MVRYCAAAAGLGAGWFVVLLVPGVTREWLLADVPVNLACLFVASVGTSVLCRKAICRADTFGEHLFRAATIPYLGCALFLTAWASALWARTLLFGGLANLHDTMSLYAMGLMAAGVSCWVVIPYGLLCQYVMSGMCRSIPSSQ